MLHLETNHQAIVKLLNNNAEHHESLLEDLQDNVGMKPMQLASEFDAPNLWGTVGEVINQLITLRTSQPGGSSIT